MIPTAQALCDILNDPTVPSEAKVFDGYNWRANPDGSLSCNASHGATVGISSAEVNAWLFWSLSAWLWSKGIQTVVQPNLPCTPVEGMAELVRQWAAVSVKGVTP